MRNENDKLEKSLIFANWPLLQLLLKTKFFALLSFSLKFLLTIVLSAPIHSPDNFNVYSLGQRSETITTSCTKRIMNTFAALLIC